MRLFTAYGHTLSSAFDLDELPHATGSCPDVTIATVEALPRSAGSGGSRSSRRNPAWLTVSPVGKDYLLQFGRTAGFHVSADGARIGVPHGGSRLADTVRHLLIDQVVPLALAHQGALVLHGSALACDEGAVAFIGPSGAGKSTLAGAFVREGWSILADDAVALVVPNEHDRARERGADAARVRVQPAYPGLRVWPDVLAAIQAPPDSPLVARYTHKRRVAADPGGFVAAPRPLRRLYVIDPTHADDVSIAPLSRRDAVIAMLTHSYVLDPGDASRLQRQFRLAGDATDALTARALSYPRDLDRLMDVQQAIRADLALGAPKG